MEENVMEQKNVERKVNVVEDLDGNRIVIIHDKKHSKDAKYGWYSYTTRFALPVYGKNNDIERYNVFRAIVLVRHAEDNKLYLYDIIKIKKETSNLFQSEDLTQ